MSKSVAPFGESDTRRPARKKIFELPAGSTSDFFTHISSRLTLSKLQTICWCGDNFTKNFIGYGPGKDKQYEISILDDKIYMARPQEGGKTLVRHNPKNDDGAAMLQVAHVKKWMVYKTLDAIDSVDSLNFELDDIVEDSSCGDDLVLPFKIVGHAMSVKWSMDTDNHRVDTMKNQDIVIEGIYAKNKANKSKYFMVKGTNTHMHVILAKRDLAGHLKGLDLDNGAKLYLPSK